MSGDPTFFTKIGQSLLCMGSSTCETPKNQDFMRKDKMVISVKIQNFSRSRMTKQTVGIVSGNLATTSNFVEFRDIRNFTFFETRRGVWDT